MLIRKQIVMDDIGTSFENNICWHNKKKCLTIVEILLMLIKKSLSNIKWEIIVIYINKIIILTM